MRLNQVTLPASDLPRSVDFYQRMGFELIVDSPEYARFVDQAGETSFSLHVVAQAASDGMVVYFECEDVDAEYRRLREAGFRFETEPQDQPWLWREARLKDPAGNRLCLYHAGENRLDPPWRVTRG